MIVVPVIDLQAGVIVRGVAGRRSEYRPLVSQLVSTVTPATLAQVFADAFGFRTVYVADLDAIAGNVPNYAAYREIAVRGLTIWLDAGLGEVQQAQRLLASCRADGFKPQLVVGLETLTSSAELMRLVEYIGSDQAIFSLDMHARRLSTSLRDWQDASPLEIATAAVEAGFRRMIVLDLADVGVAKGVGVLPLIRELRARHPTLEIISGGGVRGIADLLALETAGTSAALVASALHDGKLTRQELQKFNREASPGNAVL